MARLALLALVALGLAACSQNEVGKKVITEQCIAEGETVEVCECFAKPRTRSSTRSCSTSSCSAPREDPETEKMIEELSTQQKAKLSAVAREVITTCGAEGYLAGS